MIPARLRPEQSLLLVVDVQEKLLAAMPAARELVANVAFLIKAAKLVSVPVLATEQYPKGLGPTTSEINELLGSSPLPKTSFSCLPMASIAQPQVVVAGMETHVCVMQTVLDLLESGRQVVVPIDAVSSRHAIDHDTALGRMARAGAILATIETVGFEWIADSKHPNFKAFSQLVQSRKPPKGIP